MTISAITSALSQYVFLSIIFFFALIKTVYSSVTHRSVANLPPLDLPNKRIVPSVSYYVSLCGLRLLEYRVLTDDGYYLTMARISDDEPQQKKRKPMLLLHGLMQSYGAFCSSGADSLAIFWYNQGYDVWLANNRCGFEPAHRDLSPSTDEFWDWDINEMAEYDLPCMLNHIIDKTGQKVNLVAHSQGTTQAFLGFQSIKDRLDCFVGLAPAVYPGKLYRESPYISFMRNCNFKYAFGLKEYMPVMMRMRNLLKNSKLFGFFGYSVFNYLFHWNDKLWDHRYRSRHFLFSPVHISSKLIKWWMQTFSQGIEIDVDQSFPILLFIPGKDELVDNSRLMERFRYKYLDQYSHLDVLWARDVKDTIGVPVLDFIESVNQQY